MCGICGKYNQAGVQRHELHTMLHAIAHRGPDDEGIYLNGQLGLGNRRLSIIDLSGGHQPVCNEDETVWVVYNGEIYNYPALRQAMEKKGHCFRTNTDTEIIVHLYEEYGDRCVERLNGMFAFALWDHKQQKLLLARDQLGQKPLFYAQMGDEFLFASELKAVLAACQNKPEPNYEAIHHYLSLRFIPVPQTMFKGIKKLPPGHILTFQAGQVNVSRYWQLSFHNKWTLSEAELLDGLREKLEQVIRSHLMSDVPVGAFLSGGLDSSMIVALMAVETGKEFNTFSIGVKEDDFNELPYARQVADRYRTCHFEQRVEARIIDLLPKMIWHLDEPSDPIAACQFYAAQLASQHVKVVMGGDGGDELFAGFDRYRGLNFISYYALLPEFIRKGAIGPLLRSIPDSFTYKSRTQKLRWIHQLAELPTVGQRFAEATCFFRFNHQDKQALFGGDLWQQVGNLNSSDIIANEFEKAPADDMIDRMLYTDFMTRLPEHSLMLTDRMTMAHGLEARSPFLDHELVEFMAAFPSHLKIRGKDLKYILRQLAADYLPDAIVNRPKQGFMFPVAYWFRNELYSYIKELLLNSHFVKNGLFQRKTVLKMIEEHRHNQVDHHVRLWMLLNLELWHQIYISHELSV